MELLAEVERLPRAADVAEEPEPLPVRDVLALELIHLLLRLNESDADLADQSVLHLLYVLSREGAMRFGRLLSLEDYRVFVVPTRRDTGPPNISPNGWVLDNLKWVSRILWREDEELRFVGREFEGRIRVVRMKEVARGDDDGLLGLLLELNLAVSRVRVARPE